MYIVKAGDKLVEVNKLESTVIYPGQVLRYTKWDF